MREKKYEDYTREERAQMIVHDYDKYRSLLGPDHWYLILDGLAKIKPYEPEDVDD